jgi:putative PIN family toxin of toxin-antitoxin system
MRVVIDTNVFVSSFFGGKPRRIIDLWMRGEVALCLSPAIIEEYLEVLRRLGVGHGDEIAELLDLFARGNNIVFAAKTPSLRIVRDDPDDDKFIECAVALKAKAIITGDKSLVAVGSYMGIKIVRPAEFLNMMV